MTDEEVRYVASTSNFVCLEKAHAMKTMGSTEKGIAHDAERLKRANPRIKVLFYFNDPLNYPMYDFFQETEENKNDVLRDNKSPTSAS